MTPETHARFKDIVLGGQRLPRGMPVFADVLDQDQADAIHAYLISRANADYNKVGTR